MIHVTCVSCGETKPVHCTEEQLWQWRNGALIQLAMPDVRKEERELLISGMCGDCFKQMAAETEGL